MTDKSVRDVCEEFSKEHGYDGLFSETFQCACFNGDLICCGAEDIGDCLFGYKHKCSHCGLDIIALSKSSADVRCPECEEDI